MQTEFKIICTDKDKIGIEQGLERAKLENPYFLEDFLDNSNDLISTSSELESKNPQLLTGEVIILEDEAGVICKYFEHINTVLSFDHIPKVRQVIACTKVEVLRKLLLLLSRSKNKSVRIVFLDFHLNEENEDEGFEKLQDVIESNIPMFLNGNPYKYEVMGMSNWAWQSGTDYKGVKSKLIEMERYFYDKRKYLYDDEYMVNVLKNVFQRPKRENLQEGVNYAILDKLERKYSSKKVNSATKILDNLEVGLSKTCGTQEKFDASIHSVPNTTNGKPYARTVIYAILNSKKNIISGLLYAYKDSKSKRWPVFEHQILNHGLYPRLGFKEMLLNK